MNPVRAADPPRSSAASPFAADPAFQQRITVRVTGMPLAELLPMLSRELGVTLRPATEEVGDLRVSVFIPDRSAPQVLDALTAMLNLTPEGGFGWRKSRRVYELYESPDAHALAAARLRQEEEAVLRGFRAQVRAMLNDPRVPKLWEDAPPAAQAQNVLQLIPRLQRAALLLASLGDVQLGQLLSEGLLVRRPPDLTPAQQQTFARITADLVAYRPSSFPGEAEMYQGLDPARATLTFERDWQAPDLIIYARLGLGPGKGGARYQVYPLSPTGSERREPKGASARPQAADRTPPVEPQPSEDPPIALRPPSWTVASVLSQLARKSGRALISDCYTHRWERLASLSPMPLARLLDRLDEEYQVRRQEHAGILLLRSRRAEAWRQREVPERLILRWLQQMRRDRAISLQTLAEMAQRSEAAMDDLRWHPELASILANFHPSSVWGHKEIWRLYGLLSASQRLAVTHGGLRLFGRQMSPPQRQQFVHWLILGGRAPDAPESAYDDAELALRLNADQSLEITWSVGGRTTTWQRWLALDRDLMTGEPRPWEAGQPEAMLGRPAPPLTLRGLDGQLRTLPFPTGKPFLAYFRDTWVVPYVGKQTDTIDLDLLTTLLARRPELRDRIAVIFPREPIVELRKRLEPYGSALPVYADETGASTQAYGSAPLPRGVLIDGGQKVGLIRTGYQAVMGTDWERVLMP
jgi:hypothetical protein